MTPLAAVATAFRNYANFKGRSSRSEWWWFSAVSLVVLIAAAVFDDLVLWDIFLVFTLTMAALVVPFYAVSVRRLRDAGRSWFWVLLFWLPPLGTIVLLVLLSQRPADHRTRA